MKENRTDMVATIGFFDGVHRGHLCLIEQVKAEAQARGMQSMLVTFDQHPRQVLHTDYQPQLLSTLTEKQLLLQRTGVDRVAVLHFDQAMSQLPARDFMQQVLRQQYGVRLLVMGYDHRFGHDTDATFDDYTRWGQECGIQLMRAKELQGEHVSSSACRQLLAKGDIPGASQLLGHAYLLQGRVVHGFQVGQHLGFPTANLQPAEGKVIPAEGAYAVWATDSHGQRHGGMLNIGRRPTLDNGNNVSIEVNLLGFDGNLYETDLCIEFVQRLRPERKFESLEALKEQLRHDADNTRKILQL